MSHHTCRGIGCRSQQLYLQQCSCNYNQKHMACKECFSIIEPGSELPQLRYFTPIVTRQTYLLLQRPPFLKRPPYPLNLTTPPPSPLHHPHPPPLPGAGQALMTAAEVFVGMHSIDASKDGVPLRKVMACLDPCMGEDMRGSFPPESMAVALQQLVTRSVMCNTIKKNTKTKVYSFKCCNRRACAKKQTGALK